MAYGKAHEDFSTFERECHAISVELVNQLRVYLALPPSQFSLYKIDKEGEHHIVPPSLINALTLRPDAFWQFGIGLTLCSALETLPQELVLIHIQLKKTMENRFVVKFGNVPTEFEIRKDDKASFTTFFDFIHESIVKLYNEQYNQFVGQSTKRKLGY